MELYRLMTRDDAKKILQMFKISYPNSFTNMNIDEAKMFVNLWTESFLNIPTRIVFDAVKQIIHNDTREFAPNVAQVRFQIVSNLAPDTDQKAIHAWEEFRKFISFTSSWSSAEEELPVYNKLDSITRRLYTYREAKSLAQLDKNTLEYRRSEFIRLYKNITIKENEKMMNEGKLVELAGGSDRFLALGYTSADIEKIEGKLLTSGTRKEYQD